jgi:hypothetical protein
MNNPVPLDYMPEPAAPRMSAVPLPAGSAATGAGHALAPEISAPQAPFRAGPPLDEAAKQQFLWHTHECLGKFSQFGDTKAAFAGTIAAALIGRLYSSKAYIPLVQAPCHQWSVVTWLSAGAWLFLMLSIALAIWTVLPRLRSTQSKGFIYWANIAAYGNVELLQTSFHSQSARALNDHLLHNLFDISSKVCVPKFRTVSRCIWALVICGVLAAAGLLLQEMPQS